MYLSDLYFLAGVGRAFVYRIAWIRVKMAIITVRIVDHISAHTPHKQSRSNQKHEMDLTHAAIGPNKKILSFDLVLNSIYPLMVYTAHFQRKCTHYNLVLMK